MPFLAQIPCNFAFLPSLSGPSNATLKTGDIGFYVQVEDNGEFHFEHTVLFDNENDKTVIHSIEERGVYSSFLNDTRDTVFFRYNGASSVATSAAQLASNWSRGFCYPGEHSFTRTTVQIVGYSSADWKFARALRAGFGSSRFGSGARNRLAKYRGRENLAPQNVICSELVMLAYQLIVGVEDEREGFILLDAKHTTPATLAVYLFNSPFWYIVGRGGSY